MGTKGPLLRAKFHPHRCNAKGVGPQKLKFLLRFDQNVEYKRLVGGVSLARFSRKLQSLYLISGSLGAKISLDLLKGLCSYGGFKLRGSGYPQTFSAPCRRNCTSDPKSFRGARTCSRSSITVLSLLGLGFHLRPGWPKTLSFLFVCLFVCSSRF